MKSNDRGIPFAVPSLVLITLVTLYPLLYVLYLSFFRKLPIFGITRFAGLDELVFLLTDDRFWNALRNTGYFTASSVSLELILGFLIALLLNRRFRFRGFVRAVVLIPWAVPTVVSAKMWEWMYNGDFGVINYLLGVHVNWLGSPFGPLDAAVFMDVWKTTPFVVILLIAGMQSIPKELYQAARVDGAGSWALFCSITLPLLVPTILVILIFRTLDAFRIFDAVYVLTGGGPANTTETLSIYAYNVLFQTLQFGYGSTIAVVVFLCVGLLSISYAAVLGKGATA